MVESWEFLYVLFFKLDVSVLLMTFLFWF